MDLNKPPEEDESSILFMLLKDGKQISQVSCPNTPVKISESLTIKDIIPATYYPLKKLPQIYFHAASQNRFQRSEWQRFVNFLFERNKVAVCQHGNCELLITPPAGQGSTNWDSVAVAYCFDELSKDGEAGEFLVSADDRARESVLVRGEGLPKSRPPAFHDKGSHLIVKSEDFRRPRIIREDAQSPSPRFVSGDVTCAISRDYQEDSLDGIHPVKEQASYQMLYSLPNESLLAQGGRTRKPHAPTLTRQLPQDGEAGEFSVSADNRTTESVLVQGERVPKAHFPALRIRGSEPIVKSEYFRRPGVITENSCLRPQSSQSPSPRLMSGDASCIISRDYQEGSFDNRHPVKEQAFYQTMYSLPSETMMAQGESRSKPQTAALHRQQSQVDVKSEDFRRARSSVDNACLRAQNSPPISPGFVSGDATCLVSRNCQEFNLHNLHPSKEQALYEKIYSLPRAPINFGHIYNSSAKMPPETPHDSLKEVKQEKSDTDRLAVTPEYMITLRHMHNGWAFGALAELIDNARDANASKLDISIQMEFDKTAGEKIPILSVIDNGRGMSHLELVRMLSLGHARPTEDNRDHIGRFGVGFKAGSMQLGKDVVILTQCCETRSIAFLSRSYNENKKELVVPIITYRKEGGWMDFDLQVHSKAKAEAHLESIKKFSPFNEYSIGSKFASFAENGTGTHIYIYNLDLWGENHTLEWDEKGDDGRDLKKKRDIWIRSRLVRGRDGQVSREVPLDYSLHSYLEVMFLNPRMKITVQGTMVRTHPLARSLNKTKVVREVFLGKNVELTLGRNQEEKERGNCGMFLYWHGRLIEAYKRVGGMVQSADMGRGVIGVMDVTDLMKVKNEVMVLPNKQGFVNCEALHLLVQWLGCKADEYWDENFDTLELRDNSKRYKPDHEWVQCNKCRKWRILDPCFNADLLPPEWFCYMPPFKGSCDSPEQKVEEGIITVSTNRSAGGTSNAWQSGPAEEMNVTSVDDSIITSISNKGESEISTESENEPVVELHVPKRRLRRRGPPPSKGVAKRSRVK